MSSQNLIILYDIPSPLAGKTWSPNAWKTRYILNYKNLPHRTEWIEYPDIEGTCKSIGAPPTATRPDGQPLYTIPTIKDLSTGKVVTDSFEIAKYLDDTYPDTPAVLPKSIRGMQAGLRHAIGTHYLSDFFRFAIPAQILNPVSMEYYAKKNFLNYGVPFEEIAPKNREAGWKKLEEQLDLVDKWYAENPSSSGWITGETPTFVDIILISNFTWAKQGLKDEYEAQIAKWHGGRWSRLVDVFNKYTEIH